MNETAMKPGTGAGKNSGSKSPTKKSRLIALLSRKKGCRIGILVKELGWQPHTIRAVIARLRAEGMTIITTRSKAGLTGYQIYASLDRGNSNK